MKTKYTKYTKYNKPHPLTKYSNKELVAHDEPTCRPCQNKFAEKQRDAHNSEMKQRADIRRHGA